MMKLRIVLSLIVIVLLGAGCSFERPQPSPESLASTGTLAVTTAELTLPVGVLEETQAGVTHTPEDGLLEPTATFNPKFSSLAVVYVKGGDLWRWNPSGGQQLTFTKDAFQPKLSPDGKVVAFLRPVGDFQIQLWAININGENERILVSVDDLNTIGGGVRDPNAVAIAPYEYEWVPGTHLLAFNTQQILQGPGLFLLDDFHLVDADNLQLKMVLLAGWGGVFKVSPDGEKVVLSTPDQIAMANLDGSNYRQVLTYKPVITYSDYRYYARPVWKMDSSGLWVAIPPEDPLAEPVEATGLYEILLSEPTGRLVNQINTVSYIESPVSYSPDGQYLIYLMESGDPQAHLRELYISKPDGSGAWMYQRDYLLKFINWSIDSSHFVYAVGENQAAWLGNLQTAAQEVLPELNPITHLQWIDSENFLIARVNLEKVDLYLGNLQSPGRLIAEQIDAPLFFDFYLGIP